MERINALARQLAGSGDSSESVATVNATKRLTQLDRSVAGRVAIVTGAASGMGRATAQLFADEGARVAVVDIGEDRVNAVVAEINTEYPGRAAGFVVDVSDSAALKRLPGDVVKRFGQIDILVNNAGVSLGGGAQTPDASFEETWTKTVAINLTSHATLIRAALPYMMKSDSARIVNIASTEALLASAGNAAYNATKAGVLGLTRSFAVELGRLQNITCNAVMPGPIRTGMTARVPDNDKALYAKRRVPLRRYGEPEEVAQVTVSICTPAFSFLNGAHIPVDGGMSIRHTPVGVRRGSDSIEAPGGTDTFTVGIIFCGQNNSRVPDDDKTVHHMLWIMTTIWRTYPSHVCQSRFRSNYK
ncbi:hypothetical protein SmJEL517_g01968 [Synchytrium microbalum]|uniref:3-oxoacyl-[acyl-carrier-protein] reductase n=1 Tax=Synchytrium microbalum TaxID=1806994 RepID=A0A507CDL7_9FUNG|nr:uncharacterized protein SmJEL517_g01968 [Synchytrium microbalum]TPX35655.1 hypothetical protein SmJEL517_g01968 [Synchytrium microbalum]